MISLLDDIKSAPIRDDSRMSNWSEENSPLQKSKKWTFIEKSPHSFGGRKPFKGGAMRRTASPDYANLNKPPKDKAIKMLDQLPKNMMHAEEQEKIKTFFDSTFIKDLPREEGFRTEKKKHTSLTNPSPLAETYSKNLYKVNNNEAVFDSFSYGFDMPAGTQLNRITKKMGRW